MEKTEKNNKRGTQFRKYAQLSGAGIQMGVTIYLASLLGKWLDGYFETGTTTYTLVVTMIGVVISFVSLLAQLKRINKKYDS
ncbi:MAG: AtpZ/AtpI family protein [Flavobacteriaceae bacterium]|nr:AtpZ/AtpI family protein [Flavobacteriaceae bacterium]